MSIYTLSDNFEWCNRDSVYVPDKVRSRSVAFFKESEDDFNSLWNYDDEITTPRNPKLILDFTHPCSENEKEKCRSFWKMVDACGELQPALGIPMFPKPEPIPNIEKIPTDDDETYKYPWISQLIILQKKGIDELALRNTSASVPLYPNNMTLAKFRQRFRREQPVVCLEEILREMEENRETLHMLLRASASEDVSTPQSKSDVGINED